MKKYIIISLTIAFIWSCSQSNNIQDFQEKQAGLNGFTNAELIIKYALDKQTEVKTLDSLNISEPKKIDTITFTKKELLGILNLTNNSSFIKISKKYTYNPNIYLRKEAFNAFQKMYEKALKEGVQLTIISATRTFNHQKFIWNKKWQGKYKHIAQSKRAEAILKWSSMPGTSRHHWGTDIDLNSLSNSYFEKRKGLKVYNWLKENASQFGFCQVYTNKDTKRPHGYNLEKWHWSYLPISSKMLKAYNKQISCNDLEGFFGSEWSEKLQIIERYVNGINSECNR